MNPGVRRLPASTAWEPERRRWAARWIWSSDGPETPSNSYFLFRTELSVDGAAEGARLFITAETRYRVLVNGTQIGEGPPPSPPHYQYYDAYDLSSHLTTGANCLAVIVHFVGNEAGRELTRGGLLAEVTDAAGNVVAATGTAGAGGRAEWRVQRAAAWSGQAGLFRLNVFDPFQEIHDARRMPAGLDAPGFDDSGWARPAVLRGQGGTEQPQTVRPWSALVARDIPFMAETALCPARVVAAEECLSLNRFREDLSIDLSQPGRPLRHTRVEHVEALCTPDGGTAPADGEGVMLVQNSTEHLRDHTFDGIYDPCVLLDFGKVVTAYVELELEGAAGCAVEVGMAERLVDGYFNNAVECWFAARYVLKEGHQTFRVFSWRGFRYARLRFKDCFSPIRVNAVRAVETTYPFQERGGFRSSDETLNAVWDLCRYTLRLCSHESIMDTPWREQGQWLGDVAAVTLGGIYACFGDTQLAAKFLRQSAQQLLPTGLIPNMTNFSGRSTSPLADYSLWWVIGLWEHYRYTGEAEWIHRFYPQVLRIVQAFADCVGPHGLVTDTPYRIFADWAPVDVRGESAVANALFYGALEVVAEMARLKGDAHTAQLAERLRAGVGAAFVDRLYDRERRCFADARVDGALSQRVSEQANAAALRWGLCDEALAHEVIKTLWDPGEHAEALRVTEAQPFFMTVVLQALDRLGRMDVALRLVRDRWGGRMVARGATSAYEEWTTNGSWRTGEFRGFMRTLSHAWSAHPAEFLIRHLMGLEIVEPGCTRIRLAPRDVPFDYDLTYPTPQGDVRVTRRGQTVEHHLPGGVTLA